MATEKILVPTDLSPSAKAGMRFAIQLAAQNKSSLIFLHIIEILKPTRWSESKYRTYARQEMGPARALLEKSVEAEYGATGIRPGAFECVVARKNRSVHQTIVDQASKTNSDYICLSTRGGGPLKKLLGTNASILLTTSPVPVFVVPHKWRRAPIRKILYSSDFNDLAREMKRVRRFAAPFKASVDVYHYDYLLNVTETVGKLEKKAERYKAPGVTFNFRKQHIEESLSNRLSRDVKRSKASIAVLFTKQNRGWYERIFLSSNSAALAFVTSVPLLVFRKSS